MNFSWFNPAVAVATLSFLAIYLIFRKLSMSYMGGNLGFKIGYFLYTRSHFGYYYFCRELRNARVKFNGGPHSITKPTSLNELTIVPIAMSMDNYAYLITDEAEGVSLLVDPSDPDTVQTIMNARKSFPVAILTTHKHWDHSGGNYELRKRFPSLQVFGGATDNVPSITHRVSDGDKLTFGRLKFTVYLTPGHTVGQVVYVLDGSQFGAPMSLFSGDHLFIGGIGKLFEGTPATMLQSIDRLRHLPDTTLLWPGHEYAQSNLTFAANLEPDNVHVTKKLKEVLLDRAGRHCTCPSTLGAEKLYNPYLRTHEVGLVRALGLDKHETTGEQLRVLVLSECRARKDVFKDSF